MSQDFLRLNEKGGICYIEPMKKALGTTSAVFSALAISGCAQLQSAAPVIGMANPEKLTIHVSGLELTLFEKTIRGSLFGSANPQYDIIRLLRLYNDGQLQLDDLVTTRYTLEEVNQGYQDLREGKNIRGIIVH